MDFLPFEESPRSGQPPGAGAEGFPRRVGRQRVVLGDCLEAMRAIPPGSVDAVVTSPPYNIGIRYGRYDDRGPRDAYLAWMAEVAAAIERVLAPDGSLFLNVGGTNRDPWIPMDVAAAFRGRFVLQNRIAWVKSVSVGDRTSGHFKPINSPRYLNHTHEDLFHFTKSGAVPIDRLAVGVPFQYKSNVARRGHASDRRCAGDVWFVPYETVRSRSQKFDHPAGFPVALAERCLKLHGGSDALVLDPFMGTGTVLVATERLGHRGIGIDLDPGYAETACQRLAAIPATESPPLARAPAPGSRLLPGGRPEDSR